MQKTAAKGKTAFVFPGQGSQYPGMGKDLAREYTAAAGVFSWAGEALGFDLARLCFEGLQERLKQTEITQPAVMAVSMAVFEILRERGFEPDYVAGHSLGEYSALTAAGSFSFAEGIRVVAQRGRLMSEAVPEGQGAMAAVLGLGPEEVSRVCNLASDLGEVVPANFNSPGQIVISGNREAVEKAGELARERGAKRVIPLPVSGPFHSPLMSGVSDKLALLLGSVKLDVPRYPFVANVTGRIIHPAEEIREALIQQVQSPVLWQQSVEYLIAQGVSLFVEIGPGRVLSGLIKKIDKSVQVLNAEDCRTLESTCRVLEEVREHA